MKRKLNRSLAVAAMLMCLSTAQAENTVPEYKFGKPTTEELAMKEFTAQKDAPAVVLYTNRQTWYYMNNDIKLNTMIKTRLKVLKEEGKEYATIEIPYYAPLGSNAREQIRGLKAFTYNTNGGKTEKIKLENDMISTERVDDYHMVKKVAMPQVKVGSIIDIQYTLESDFIENIDPWFAQRAIPVVYAEYDLVIPDYFKFAFNSSGTQHLETIHEPTTMNVMVVGGTANITGEHYNFKGYNLPGLKADDYIYSAQAFRSNVKAELISFALPGQTTQHFSTTWEDVNRMLYEDESFGGRVKRSNPLKDAQKAVDLSKYSTNKEKVAALYEVLKSQLKWNGNHSFRGEGASKLKKDGAGTDADLNFVLINMLKEAKINAYPVVLRNRRDGFLPVHPTLESLNTVITGFDNEDGSKSYIDASYEDGFIDVLPTSLLVNEAYAMVSNGVTQPVKLSSLPESRNTLNITATVAGNGTIKAHAKKILLNNDAANFRKDFRETQDSTKFVNKKAQADGIAIDSYKMEGVDGFSNTVTVDYDFNMTTEANGDHVYVNPFVLTMIDNNPFTSEKRELPVEFGCKHTILQSVKLDLPEGYSVEEMPKSPKMTTPDGSMSLTITLAQQGNSIYAREIMKVNRQLFTTEEYPIIRQMYESLVQKSKDMIVLKKL